MTRTDSGASLLCGPATVAGVEERTPAVRSRVGYAWIWASVWLIYLGQPFVLAWHQPTILRRALALATLAAFAGLFVISFVYIRRLRRQATLPPRVQAWTICAVEAALAVAVTAMLGPHATAVWPFVAVMTVFLLPSRAALAGVLVLLAGTTVGQRLAGWHDDYSTQFGILVSALAVWGVVQLIGRNAELAAAREEITQLAVAEERNRFARDLHDILGHTLTVVAVKAELAGRLVQLDPERAEAEIASVEHLARQALADVRTAVAGFREVSLAGELVGARAALETADIEAELPAAIDDVPAARRELFGWAVREGVTNVVRHSGAKRCRVRVTASEVEVTDDGRGPSSGDATGHGLVGLRERAEAAGGSITVGRSPEGGFSLLVRV
jgi:two-component system, NarL family, sensor histidine kinase DesK